MIRLKFPGVIGDQKKKRSERVANRKLYLYRGGGRRRRTRNGKCQMKVCTRAKKNDVSWLVELRRKLAAGKRSVVRQKPRWRDVEEA